MGKCDKCGVEFETLCPLCTIPILTDLERKVLILIARGLNSIEIASEVNYSVSTVKKTRRSLSKKLLSKDIGPNTVARAYDLGILAH